VIDLTGDETITTTPNVTQGTETQQLAGLLNDPFAYDPSNPTSPMPQTTWESTKFFIGTDTYLATIAYDFDDMYDNLFVDLYGRNAFEGRDDSFDVEFRLAGVLQETIATGIDSSHHVRVTASPGTQADSIRIVETAGSANKFALAEIRVNSFGPNVGTSISMIATTADDASGVEYYFAETSGNAGGDDSGWQDSAKYIDWGLLPYTQYIYTVTARDKSTNQNETAASAAASATTGPASDPVILKTASNGTSASGGEPGPACPTIYDVYFGQDNPPTVQIASDINDTIYDPDVLEPCTTYYWQVVAKNISGETVGPVWSFTTKDVTAPEINCPDDIAVSGVFGGAVVTYAPTATDGCDPNPIVTTDIPSGSVFEKGVTTVTVTATDASGNSSICTFDVIVSCFGIDEVKIKTDAGKPVPKRMRGRRPNKDDDVTINGTFNAAVPLDLAVDDVLYIIDDGRGNVLEYLIPAGSFKLHGIGEKHNPADQKFEFHTPRKSSPSFEAKFDFDKCEFELRAKKIAGIEGITAGDLTVTLQAGANIGQETVELKLKGKRRDRYLEYKAKLKPECCPK
jgi:hypothetical protein